MTYRRTRRLLIAGTVLVAVMALMPAAATAQFDLGVRGGLYLDQSDAFLGFELLDRIGDTRWFINPNVEWVFVERGDLFTLNGDVHYDLRTEGPLNFWAGGGLALVFREPDRGDGETDAGVNLLAGLGLNGDRQVRPFVQTKILISGESEAVLAFGVRF